MSLSFPLDQVYSLQEKIGRGSFGQVYKGINKQTGQTVAIKVLDLDSKEEDIDVIQREIFLLQHCDSEFITRYHASYLQGTKLCVVMDYAKGGSLRDILRSGAVDEIYISIIIRDVLYALCYLHKSGIIHRDIKAANVLLTEEGKVKLCDFGVAGQFSVKSLKRHSFVGTPFWMAPEVMKRTAYDFKADIWSLGITTFEIATGGPPQVGKDPMRALLISDFKDIQLPETFSSLMKDFMAHCLNEDPKLRPSADELLRSKWIRNAPKESNLLLDLVVRHSEWQMTQGEASSCKTGSSEDDMNQEKQGDEWNFDSIQSGQLSGRVSPLPRTKFILENSPSSNIITSPASSSNVQRKGHRRNQTSVIKVNDALLQTTMSTSPTLIPERKQSHPVTKSETIKLQKSFSERIPTSDSPLIHLFSSTQLPMNPDESIRSKESIIAPEWKTSPSLPFIIDTTILSTLSDPERPTLPPTQEESLKPTKKSLFFSKSRAMDSRMYKPIQLISSALKKDPLEETTTAGRPRSSTAPEMFDPWDSGSFRNTVNRLSFLLNFTTRSKRSFHRSPSSDDPNLLLPPLDPHLTVNSTRANSEKSKHTSLSNGSITSPSDESAFNLFQRMRSTSMSAFFQKSKSEPPLSLDRPSSVSLDRSLPTTSSDPPFATTLKPNVDSYPLMEPPSPTPFKTHSSTALKPLDYYQEIVNRTSMTSSAHALGPKPITSLQVPSLGELNCPAIVGRPDQFTQTDVTEQDQKKQMEDQLNELCDACWYWLDLSEKNMRRIAMMERSN